MNEIKTSRAVPRAIGVLVATMVAVGLAACMPEPSPWTVVEAPRVAFVGDSLVHSAQTGGGIAADDPDRFLDDDAALRGLSTSVSARIGAQTAELSGIEQFPAPGLDALVVALGTNDMNGPKVSVAEAMANLVTFIDRIAAPCTVVVNVLEAPSWGLDVTAPPYNAALAALAAARDDVLLADWHVIASAHPEYLRSDGVHHNEIGGAAYRDLMLDAATDCLALALPAPSTTTTTEPESTTTTSEPESTTTTSEPESTSTTTEPESTTTTGPESTTTTEPESTTTSEPDPDPDPDPGVS